MNAEKAKPEVAIELAGQVYALKYTTNAACELEKALGRETISGEFIKNAGVREFRALLWVMIKDQSPGLSIEQAGDLMPLERFPDIVAALGKAYIAAMPGGEGGEATEKKGVS